MGALPQFTSDALGGSQPYELFVTLEITAAKTARLLGARLPQAAFGFDAASGVTDALGQTTIDRTLGLSGDVVAATAFGSTAMGTDALGLVLNCEGQVRTIRYGSVSANVGAGGAQVSAAAGGVTTALPNTLPALARFAVTPAGNIALQAVLAGLDTATAGVISIRILVDLK
jgi:hypothetical protein